MTVRDCKIRKPRKNTTPSPGTVCFGLFSLFCLCLILRNSDIAVAYMTRGLLLCAKTVIPSLFPFMVISEILVSSGIGEWLCRPFSPLCKKLFRISPAGTCAVLLGMLCGFPIGAKCAMNELDQGRISREEATRILAFSNNPSSAFLITAVGVSLWGNRCFGIALYTTVLLAQMLTGILYARVAKPNAEESLPVFHQAPPKVLGASLFTDAVRNACFGMLLVCAYVIFFSAFMGTLGLMLEALSLPAFCKAAAFCLFELSGGISAASSLASPQAAALLAAFAVGWSGISVHCQILSVCEGRGIRFRTYFLAKMLQSLLCVLLFLGAITCFPSLLLPAQESVGITLPSLLPLPLSTCLFAFSTICLPFLKRRSRTGL